MRILFIGDIFGAPGRKIIESNLKKIVEEKNIDFVIANAENSAHGKGITEKIYRHLMEYGINVLTMGNHTWAKPGIEEVLALPNIVRPMNLKPEYKYYDYGTGSIELTIKNLKVRITNLLGSSVFVRGAQTNPFIAMRDFLSEIEKPDIHIVDLHAETTSEKYAFLWAFNGQVSAIIGTHTHVPTNDACITHEGTAFICDVGMTGPSQGIIGAKKDGIIKKFFNPELSFMLDVQSGPKQMCSVIMEFDEVSKKMKSIVPFIIREGFEDMNS